MFNNRKNCGCTGTTVKPKTDTSTSTTTPVTPVVPVVEQKPEFRNLDTSNTCHAVEIKSISKVGDKVIVTLNDCTYLEADFSVVDESVHSSVLGSLQQAINQLQEKVELNSMDLENVNETITNLATDTASKLSTLETKTSVLDNLTEVTNFSGTSSVLTLTKLTNE